jgi:hypothetical protein
LEWRQPFVVGGQVWEPDKGPKPCTGARQVTEFLWAHGDIGMRPKAHLNVWATRRHWACTRAAALGAHPGSSHFIPLLPLPPPSSFLSDCSHSHPRPLESVPYPLATVLYGDESDHACLLPKPSQGVVSQNKDQSADGDLEDRPWSSLISPDPRPLCSNHLRLPTVSRPFQTHISLRLLHSTPDRCAPVPPFTEGLSVLVSCLCFSVPIIIIVIATEVTYALLTVDLLRFFTGRWSLRGTGLFWPLLCPQDPWQSSSCSQDSIHLCWAEKWVT